MIFFLPPQKYESKFRYTAFNPANMLEFLVITKNKESANKLQLDWIIESCKLNDRSEYIINLLILSEQEFLSEYDGEEAFQELLGTAVVVYEG